MKKIIVNCLRTLGAVLLFGLSFSATAQDEFVVKDIRVQGLERIQLDTVLNYLPIKVGERLTSVKTAAIVRAMYETGFFHNIALDRKDNTLVITVSERATISAVTVKGNREINKQAMQSVLKQVGLTSGEFYQKSTLEALERELQREYNARGRYNADIKVSVNDLPQNRVAIKIDISEGRVAKIKKIRIIGNETFSESELVDEFTLTTSGLFTFITRKDNYNQQQLNLSLEALRSFYLDRGFIKFQIESSQVQLSVDKKEVYITVTINEGPRYIFEGFRLAGKLELPEERLLAAISIESGEYFSRKTVSESLEALKAAYGNVGYGFPQVQAETRVNEETREVFITFVIAPGQQVYVRRINFKGNAITADEVLRYDARQDEGGLLALEKVKETQRRLRTKRYIRDAKIETVPVTGTNNQVDLDVTVDEAQTGAIHGSIGYGTQGVEFNLAIDQYNFMGTGRSVGLNFNTNKLYKNIGFNYFDPNFTPEGIGFGFDVYYSRMTPQALSLAPYSMNRLGAGGQFSFPMGDNYDLSVFAGYENSAVLLPTAAAGKPNLNDQIAGFFKQQGENVQIIGTLPQYRLDGSVKYNHAKVGLSWVRNTLDRYPNPTSGSTLRVRGEARVSVDDKKLNFYKADVATRIYFPLPRDFIFVVSGAVAYGNQFNGKGLPFFENYYAGGLSNPGQVRGFANYSLGPRGTSNVTCKAPCDPRKAGNVFGGNLVTSGSVAMILPYPLSRESVRTNVFVDAGNVYAVNMPSALKGTNSGPVRLSAGIGVDWQSIMGPLSFSLAFPLNAQKEKPATESNPMIPKDEIQYFNFTVQAGL